ncbi:hypothetical protein KFK09_022424 [Dendrobium nobile]|uniref:Uncharacterized protein n=1 Tax=Dendrobium nobile TaxID=94219 RepID=A0A8T3AII4_DENNO|nr:hypothetical protein KFK09_022424 [Dendrobium nobile]
MEEFPHFCVQCKSIGHLPDECHSSNPMFDSVNKKNYGEMVNAVEINVVVGGINEVVAVDGPVENSIPTVTSVSINEVMVNVEISVDDTLALQNFNGNTEDATIVEGLACSSLDALSLTHSCGINEGLVEALEPNNCLVNLVASPIVNSISDVEVSDGETVNSDDLAHLDLADRECVSPVGGNFPVESCVAAKVF